MLNYIISQRRTRRSGGPGPLLASLFTMNSLCSSCFSITWSLTEPGGKFPTWQEYWPASSALTTGMVRVEERLVRMSDTARDTFDLLSLSSTV